MYKIRNFVFSFYYNTGRARSGPGTNTILSNYENDVLEKREDYLIHMGALAALRCCGSRIRIPFGPNSWFRICLIAFRTIFLSAMIFVIEVISILDILIFCGSCDALFACESRGVLDQTWGRSICVNGSTIV